MIIFMNHLSSFFHAIEHEHSHEICSVSSKTTAFDENLNVSETCLYCKVFLNIDYKQHESIVYSLVAPDSISQDILGIEKQLLSVTLYKKKSRSPPSYHS